MWLAAYFLSRCGVRDGRNVNPPARLAVSTWQDAYLAFFEALADGRAQRAFVNTMKQARDDFDGHLDSGRRGWRSGTGPEETRPPKQLRGPALEVFQQCQGMSDHELWLAIEPMTSRSEMTEPGMVGTEGSRPEAVDTADALADALLEFGVSLDAAGLNIDLWLASRFVLSLATRRFVILSGLSGSGKTKLAQAFGAWLSSQSGSVDPFHIGAIVAGDKARYVVTAADAISVELASETGKTGVLMLPRRLIQEAVDQMVLHGYDRETPPRKIREAVLEVSGYSSQLVSHESHLKAAAVLSLEAVRTDAHAPAYLVVPVGSDWTGSDHVLGYQDPLDASRYVAPSVLRFILQAIERPLQPHILVLDEMNLSHVERYFADLLSAMESGEPIELHNGTAAADGLAIPRQISIPANLFVVGTVNVDETTYAFSPKVLDRSSVIEFRVPAGALGAFVRGETAVDVARISGLGAQHSATFMQAAVWDPELPAADRDALAAEIELWNTALEPHRREFAFRTAREIRRFVALALASGAGPNGLTSALDASMCQKVLPRLSGSRRELEPVLLSLQGLVAGGRKPGAAASAEGSLDTPMYPISAAKIARMLAAVRATGFAAFAEG